MRKVMTIVGTRPEIIKMSRVISEFNKHANHILVHTGQNYDYELNDIFFDDLSIPKPQYFLEAAGESASQTIGSVIQKTDKLLDQLKPDALLLYGDTNSCMSVIAAKRHKIPVFHMEAGNRCFDQRVPEELNRRVVDHLSDINLVLTEHARRHLIAEGLPQRSIIKTGSHMREVLDYYMTKIYSSEILNKLNLHSGKYFIFSAHREENIDNPENLADIIDSLNLLAEVYGFPVVVSTHPRIRKKLNSLISVALNNNIKLMKPFSFCDYIKLQMESFCVISDSGTLTEEAYMLNFPAVMMRNSHERPEGMDAGLLIMSGLKKNSILESVRIVIDQKIKGGNLNHKIDGYEERHVSTKILRIVFSYIDSINELVWHK